MPSISFGTTGGSAFTGNSPLTTGPVALSAGRAMANGSTKLLLQQVRVRVGGNGATRNINVAYRGASTGSYAVASQSHPVPLTPSQDFTVNPLVSGGTSNLTVALSGSCVFDRGSTGDTTDGVGSDFPGTIGGVISYGQGPTAPTIGTVSSAAVGTATVAFTASSDDGDAAISTYRVEYSVDSFAHTLGFVETTTSPATISGLAPGVVYQFRVAARNAVTDAAGTVGVYSSTGSVTILGGVYVGKAGSWVQCGVYAGINGVWVPVQVFAGRSGAWVPLTS